MTEDDDIAQPKLRKIRAERVWSIGRNGKNDGGLNYQPLDLDDCRARIRLK